MRKNTKSLTYTALCTALITACAWISIPFPTVPVTLQSFAVCTVAGLLGAKNGTAAVIVYLLLGAVGLPVFSGFSGGMGVILGAGGGFILGFVPAALAAGLLSDKWGNSFGKLMVATAAGHLVCYICGVAWFCLIYASETSLSAAVITCVLPYILPDIMKIIVSSIIVSKMKNKVKI